MPPTFDSLIDQAVYAITSFQPTPPKRQDSHLGATANVQTAIEETQPLSHERNSPSLAADLLHGPVSDTQPITTNQPTSQQNSKQRFTRPLSSGDNIANGFAFGKAKLPVINMSRKLGQANSISIASSLDLNAAESRHMAIDSTLANGIDTTSASTPFNITTATNDNMDDTGTKILGTYAAVGSRTSLTVADEETVPAPSSSSPKATPIETLQVRPDSPAGITCGVSPPAKVTESIDSPSKAPLFQKPMNDVQSIEVSPLQSKVVDNITHEAYPTSKSVDNMDPHIVSPSQSRQPSVLRTVLESGKLVSTPPSTTIQAHTPRRMQRPIARTKPSTPKETRLPATANSKVAKPRRKNSRLPVNNVPVPLDIFAAPSMPSQEDLMDVLLARYKRDKQSRDEERIAHATELQDLKDISDLLWEQLQEERAKGQRLGEKISVYQAKLPSWDAKVRKLSDFVQGLTNDHHGLRDKAREIQNNQNTLRAVKTQLESDFSEMNRSIQTTTSRTKDALAQARVDMQSVVQKSQNQEEQLQSSVRMLHFEKERNHQSVGEIGKLTAKHEDLVQSLTAQGNMHMEKLNNLSNKLCQSQNEERSGTLMELKGIMNQCMEVVDGLRDKPTIKSEDLQQLNNAMTASSDRILESMQSFQRDANTLGIRSQESISSLQQDVQDIGTRIKEERSLNERLTESYNAKCALERRVGSAEAALNESRKTVTNTDAIKSRLQQRIDELEAEAKTLRNRATDSSAKTEQLLNIDLQNKAIKDQLEDLHKANADASKTLREKLENYADLQLRLEDTNSRLSQQQEQALDQAKEHESASRQVRDKYEEENKKLLEDARFETNAMEARHRLEVSELKHKLSVADDRAAKERQDCNKARVEKQSSDEIIQQQVAIITQVQNEKGAAASKAKELSEGLQQARADTQNALELAEVRLRTSQNLEAQLSQEKSSRAISEEEKSKVVSKLEDQETKTARLQHSIQQADAEVKEKNDRIHDLEVDNAELVSQMNAADEARRYAETRMQEEAGKAVAAAKAYEAICTANTPSNPRNHSASTQRREEESPIKPRRKAHRNAAKHDRSAVEDSQPQSPSKSLPVPPITPERVSAMFDHQAEDNEEPLYDIASFFQDTPGPSSQLIRPSVKFVADSLEMTYHHTSLASQSREDDSTLLDYIRMSQVESGAEDSMLDQNPGGMSPTKPTANKLTNSSQVESGQVRSPPKGILKPGRPVKRNAESASLNTSSNVAKRRGRPTESQGLGPVIQDSQSQTGSQSRARSRRASGPVVPKQKVDKYTARFSQELTKDS